MSSMNQRLHRQLDEQQVILRLPPSLATHLQQQLDDKLVNGQTTLELPYQIEFIDNRHALFRFNGDTYAAVLLDLPCVVESSRFGDAKKLYKNLDVHQILQVDSTPIERTDNDFCLEDGITHVTKGAKTRFRKDPPEYSPDRVSVVEGLMKNVFELKYNLVKGDAAIRSETLEFLEEDLEDSGKEPTTVSVEEEEPKSSPLPPQESSINFEDVMLNPEQRESMHRSNVPEQGDSSVLDVEEDIPSHKVGQVNILNERKSESLEAPQEDNLNTPISPQVEQQKVLEAQRKAERFKLEKSIEAQQSKIRQMEEKIRDVSNRALKQRMQQRLDDMNQELARLEAALEQHDREYNLS